MTIFHKAILGMKALWRSILSFLPQKDKQTTLPFVSTDEQKKRLLREVLTTVVVLSIVGYSVYRTVELMGYRWYSEYTINVLKHAVGLPYIFLSPLVLGAIIFTIPNVKARFPRLSWTLLQRWRRPGEKRVNVILRPAKLPYVGLVYTALLLLLVPTFASWEELLFRDQSIMAEWPVIGTFFEMLPEWVFVIAWSMLIFGLIHMLSGVELSEALVLGFVGGLYFSIAYRYWGGLAQAIVAHTSYNILAITFMVSPKMQRMVARAFKTTANSLAPKEGPGSQ